MSDKLTTDRTDPALHEKEPSGMNKKYLVLSEEERRKGFQRPVRRSYVHVGIGAPQGELRDLTPAERERYEGRTDWARYEAYPKDHPSGMLGRYWSQADLDRVGKGCGTLTTMGQALSETYARQPGFYGATFCCGCGTHLPVGHDGEFVWEGTDERVGT